ncbi:MAG: ferritin-like domain-containing protein [Desulforegulaceae bacterium]|jgi:rubrerythrin|nr:ferritin-like domain-containing protein [Desulforegulaceae bacterium]
MEDYKKNLTHSYKMEMIGTGIYKGLSKQFRTKNPDLSEKFMEFSKQEEMHGKLFQKCFKDLYGKNLKSGFFWEFAGMFAAFIMRPIPLQKKLKKLQIEEQGAVKKIEKLLNQDIEPKLKKILKIIYPHEILHASLYNDVFK